MRGVERWRSVSPYALAVLLAAAGVTHFAVPDAYVRILPPALPAPRALVYLSGVGELACAVGLLLPRTRRVAGWATAALFVVVLPANVQMALDSGDRSLAYQVAVWARLPLQVPLVVWAVSLARTPDRSLS
ncbi:MAG: DoxX family protein [Actinomycetota bacterium]|nr:DoxX family protein [Actinomycetota bacterium]